MSTDVTAYRDLVIRCVLGSQPAMLAREHDPASLDSICRRLADAAEAKRLLCAKGYAHPAQSLADVVRALPSAKVD